MKLSYFVLALLLWMLALAMAAAMGSCRRSAKMYPQGQTACAVEVPGAAGRCAPIGAK